MNITETSADGLKREFQIVIPAQDIEEKVNGRLEELRRTVQLPGFRPGKVPANVVRQRYRANVMAEVLEQLISDTSRSTLADRSLRPALQPKIEVESFDDGADLAYKMAVELLPEFEPGDVSGIELEKPVAAVTDEAVNDSLNRLASARRTTEAIEGDHAAGAGDVAVIDFKGSVDGVSKPGMDAEAYPLELGSNRFIPGFEEQIIGAKTGEHRTVTVTFPADYPAADLAGKEAVFEIDVKELRRSVMPSLDDELAKSFGMESLDKLKESVADRIKKEYGEMSRQRIKRQLLDKLAETHSFPVPEGMVDIEFEGIWNRVQEEIKAGHAPEEAAKPEEELKAEYRSISERRVRLGLLLSEIGRRNSIDVTQEEMNRALVAEVRRYPGQEREVFDFYKKHPQALDNLRAPIFEDKVVDFVLELAKVTERAVSFEELMRDPDEDDVKAA